MEENIDLSKNIELNNVLKEFETKSSIEQVLKTTKDLNISETPKMVQLVMKWFKIQQKEAEYILVGFVVLAITISIFLFFTNIIPKKSKIIPQFREDIESSVREKLPPGVFETIPSKYD